jgi:hypothetical protein
MSSNKKHKTPWTRQEIEDFRLWHQKLLVDLRYPYNIVVELSIARDNFLAQIPLRKL